ncbi:MAG: XdhC family protein [Janthinobacterium lividum]
MDNVDLQVLRTAQHWLKQDRRVVLFTVVRTWGSAPRPVGSLLALSSEGKLEGSVSGGCIEDDLIEQMHAGRLDLKRVELLRYGVTAEAAHRFGLPCGGTLELVAEPLGAHSAVPELLDCIARERLAARHLDLASGVVHCVAADHTEFSFDGKTLISTHGSAYKLLIIGAGQLSHYLASMALAAGYRVLVCDPREEYARSWSVAGSEFTREMPDDAVLALCADHRTAVVALTHDPKLDDLALMEALRSDAFYVGAIGSRRNQEKRRERLKLFDLSDAQLAALHGPVGLHLGALTPVEIAISIIAEMTAVKNGVEVRQSQAMRGGDPRAMNSAEASLPIARIA